MAQVVLDVGNIPQPAKQIGMLGLIRRAFVGDKVKVLKEDRIHISGWTIAMMVVVSFFGIQIFALSDIQSALSGDITAAVIALAIVASFIISDYAAPLSREMARAANTRNDTQQARMFNLYAYFVYFADGYTVTMALWRQIAHIPITMSLPDFLGIPGFWNVVETILRGVLVTFTVYMLHDVTKKRDTDIFTFARKFQEATGGMIIESIDSSKHTLAESWDHFIAASHIFQKEPRTESQKASAERLRKAETELKAALTHDVQSIQEATTNAIVSEIAELKALVLALQESQIRKPKATASTNETGYKAMLLELGIESLSAVKRKDESSGKIITKAGVSLRGGWVNRSAIITLSDAQLSEEEATNLARSLGEGFKYGTSYAAPLTNVLKSLAERNKLHSVAQAYMIASAKTADTTDQ